MRYLILLALAAVLLFSGCIQQPAPPTSATPATTCPSHYLKIGNECCLDANGNGICDRDEQAQNSSACPPQNKTLEDRVNDCNHDTNCLIRLAIDANNPGICTSMPYAQLCLEPLAARYSNPGYCNLIMDPAIRQGCLKDIGSTNSSQ